MRPGRDTGITDETEEVSCFHAVAFSNRATATLHMGINAQHALAIDFMLDIHVLPVAATIFGSRHHTISDHENRSTVAGDKVQPTVVT